MVATKPAPPARRPGSRRPIPPLVFLLVLALLALVVWLKVLQKDEDDARAAQTPSCTTASKAQLASIANLKNVKVRVLNGSGIRGLAAAMQTELGNRGFTVVGIGNADENNQAVGEIHYGPKGKYAATLIAAHAGGFTLVPDSRIKDTVVLLEPGEAYKGLVEPKKAAAAAKKVVTAEQKARSTCPTGPSAASAAA